MTVKFTITMAVDDEGVAIQIDDKQEFSRAMAVSVLIGISTFCDKYSQDCGCEACAIAKTIIDRFAAIGVANALN